MKTLKGIGLAVLVVGSLIYAYNVLYDTFIEMTIWSIFNLRGF